MDSDSNDTSRLCYLSADHLEGPLPTFDRLDLRTFEDEPIGRLDGIIIDRPAKRMRYFVVDTGDGAHHRVLLPLCPTRLDAKTHTLCVDVKESELERCEAFDPRAFRTLSDEDLRKVVFYDARKDVDNSHVSSLNAES